MCYDYTSKPQHHTCYVHHRLQGLHTGLNGILEAIAVRGGAERSMDGGCECLARAAGTQLLVVRQQGLVLLIQDCDRRTELFDRRYLGNVFSGRGMNGE